MEFINPTPEYLAAFSETDWVDGSAHGITSADVLVRFPYEGGPVYMRTSISHGVVKLPKAVSGFVGMQVARIPA